MHQPLPPLSSLRSFETVARQLGFRKAAQELHITPGRDHDPVPVVITQCRTASRFG